MLRVLGPWRGFGGLAVHVFKRQFLCAILQGRWCQYRSILFRGSPMTSAQLTLMTLKNIKKLFPAALWNLNQPCELGHKQTGKQLAFKWSHKQGYAARNDPADFHPFFCCQVSVFTTLPRFRVMSILYRLAIRLVVAWLRNRFDDFTWEMYILYFTLVFSAPICLKKLYVHCFSLARLCQGAKLFQLIIL